LFPSPASTADTSARSSGLRRSRSSKIFVILAALVLLVLARLVQQWLYGQTVHALFTESNNPAMGIAVAGYVFSVIWTTTVLLGNLSYALVSDILSVLLYGCVGIVLLTGGALGAVGAFFGMRW